MKTKPRSGSPTTTGILVDLARIVTDNVASAPDNTPLPANRTQSEYTPQVMLRFGDVALPLEGQRTPWPQRSGQRKGT